MKIGKLFTLFLSLSIFAVGCSSGSAENRGGDKSGEELTVFAAAHLTEAFTDIEKAFEKRTGADVTISFAGTQTLRTQIEQGAPADVFASANVSHMKAVKKEGLVGHYAAFAYNTLVLIVPKDNPAGIENLKDLAGKNTKLVVGVDNVPVGIYTRQMLENANKQYGSNFEKKVLSNVVSNELNVKKVANKVTLGAADAGIIYETGVTPSVGEKVKEIKIPEKLNVTATDTIAAIKDSNHPQLAKKWVDFVLSDEGQKILADHKLISLVEKEK